MVCLRDVNCAIVGSELTLFESEMIIKELSDIAFFVPGGSQIKGITLKGSRPFPVGISGNDIYFQYVKPCFGIFVLQIENCPDDVTKLKDDFLKNKYEMIE
ncbi:DUF1894 domain-containing protein [Methanolapillus millepedarum]|uniref:DUF1894 domain-containing protein n=1 Tax=Methanolapillus millepedarum TaxID=3028296 RepID=A0AA96VC82_9EURY|nr:hypothetical protein MsAc7_10980 [Methanosarcinaceae archaeon Ac7]